MGRSSYTASTVTHLSHAAGSGCLSISSHHAGESSHIKLLDTLPAALNDSINSSSSSVATTSARVKDTPTSWAQRQFDPDDESLPAVEERFLEPYEEELQAELDEASDNDDYIDDDDDESRWDDEDEERHQDVIDSAERLIHAQSVSEGEAPPLHARSWPAITELATALMGSEGPPHAIQGFQTADQERALQSEQSRMAGRQDDEEEEYDEPPHGNGGYYDYGYSREDEQVIDRRSTPSIVDDFSPSAGVFHRHTLPFNLPNMDEMQVQRRTSNSIVSNLPASAASTYAF